MILPLTNYLLLSGVIQTLKTHVFKVDKCSSEATNVVLYEQSDIDYRHFQSAGSRFSSRA